MDKIESDARAVKTGKKMMRFAWLSIAIGIILLVLEAIFEGNPVIDFIRTALPWILLGLMLLSSIIYLDNKKAAESDEFYFFKLAYFALLPFCRVTI